MEWNRVRKIKYACPFFQIYTREIFSLLSFIFSGRKQGYQDFSFLLFSFSFVFENGYLWPVVKSNGILSYREIYACNLKILCIM